MRESFIAEETFQDVRVIQQELWRSVKHQRVAEAAMDSMKQQMTELCRSDMLMRTREQHDRDTSAIREQYEARLLTLQQKLDAQSQSLNEQAEAGQRLLDQVRQLERQREEDQVDRASVINTLTQRLEESQQQCAKLLHTEERQRVLEEVLEDLKEVLQEGVERRGSPDEHKIKTVPGIHCRESLRQAINQAKQEWKKSSEDKLRRVLKETQERHEAEIAGLTAQRKEGERALRSESLAKLQKKNQELQRHLEKACRQLQKTVREHKNNLQKIKGAVY